MSSSDTTRKDSITCLVLFPDRMKGFGTHLSSDHCYKHKAHLQVLPWHISSQKCDMRLARHLLSAQVHPMLFHAPLRLRDEQPWILDSVKAKNMSASPNTVTTMVLLLKIEVFSLCTRPKFQKESIMHGLQRNS